MTDERLSKKEQIALTLKWFDEEDIPAYSSEYVDKDEGQVFITVGEYDYEISAQEIEYRASLIQEQES